MSQKSRFTQEEKKAAVKLVTEGGRVAASVANEYGIHENTLWKWRRQYEMNPEGAFAEKRTEGPDETERLRRRVRELENEVEFLKKVSAYFSRNPQ